MEKLNNQLRNDKSIFDWWTTMGSGNYNSAEKKPGKPTCIVYRTGSFVLKDKSSTEF